MPLEKRVIERAQRGEAVDRRYVSHAETIGAAAHNSTPDPGEIDASYVAARIAAWLRATWPANTAKHAASYFEVSVETARGWLKGGRPQSAHFDRMVLAFDVRFLVFIYAEQLPDGPVMALAADLHDLRAHLHRVDSRLGELMEEPA